MKIEVTLDGKVIRSFFVAYPDIAIAMLENIDFAMELMFMRFEKGLPMHRFGPDKPKRKSKKPVTQ
jgi:hypothetical protein